MFLKNHQLGHLDPTALNILAAIILEALIVILVGPGAGTSASCAVADNQFQGSRTLGSWGGLMRGYHAITLRHHAC